jgi:hypothetical protein
MTDTLLDRFAALADPTDDSDWLDVRRRARPSPMRVAMAAAAGAAVVAAATALAAAGGWVFSTHDHHVTAATTVSLDGKSWNVSITTGSLGRVCFRVEGSTGPTCTGRLDTLRRARPFGAVSVKVPGGQIWLGATIGFARRVVVTTTDGHSFATETKAAPRRTKTPFRYWALAVSGRAKWITAHDAHGHAIRASATPRIGSTRVSE